MQDENDTREREREKEIDQFQGATNYCLWNYQISQHPLGKCLGAVAMLFVMGTANVYKEEVNIGSC